MFRSHSLLACVTLVFTLGFQSAALAQGTGAATQPPNAVAPRQAPPVVGATVEPPAANGENEPRGMAAMRMENLSDEAARSHFRVGQALYAAGRYPEAGREFESAYELSRRPALLYNAFLAYRDASDRTNSIRTLDAYLTAQPDAPDHEVLSRRLAAMRESEERDVAAERASADERTRLEAERQRLADEVEARRLEEERAAAAIEAERSRRSKGPYILMGTAGGLLLASGAMALVTNARNNDASAKCPDHRCPLSENLDAVRASVRRPAIATDVLLGAGVITLVSSVIWLARDRKHAHEDAPRVSASCGRSGCDLQYRLSF